MVAILGNSVFESVRNITVRYSTRHDAIFNRFESECNISHLASEKMYVTQDGTGGGGIGNLFLKIKYVLLSIRVLEYPCHHLLRVESN